MIDANRKIEEAIDILAQVGLPKAQQNERSALCLLALVDLRPDGAWANSSSPLMGITPIMDWAREAYGKVYAPNTRETFRRLTMHQFVDAGLALYNPDQPDRPVNSPKAVYQIAPAALDLLRSYGTEDWDEKLSTYIAEIGRLVDRYAQARKQHLVPVELVGGGEINLSPGAHSILIKQIIEDFAPRFAPGSQLIYAGDTGSKYGYYDTELLEKLGVKIEKHGKMPDVVLYYGDRNWLLLVESVTSHGPVDSKRHVELQTLFENSTAGIVYVTAFPNRQIMAKYIPVISWETEVWSADAPSHLIHFNGVRFLGPYKTK